MKENLTRKERNLIARIEDSGNWDHLTHNLTILIPSLFIVGLGLHFDSPFAVAAGVGIHAVLMIRLSLVQAETMQVLKSLIKKLAEDLDE